MNRREDDFTEVNWTIRQHRIHSVIDGPAQPEQVPPKVNVILWLQMPIRICSYFLSILTRREP
jgi:hypothetical protein